MSIVLKAPNDKYREEYDRIFNYEFDEDENKKFLEQEMSEENEFSKRT